MYGFIARVFLGLIQCGSSRLSGLYYGAGVFLSESYFSSRKRSLCVNSLFQRPLWLLVVG